MARGTIAKTKVAETLMSAFGKDYICELDKKYYVWADDGGERVQIAISLTCPKNIVGLDLANADTQSKGDFNWDDSVIEASKPQVEITQEEKENIARLMEKFGL